MNNFTKIKFSISDVKDDAQILIQKKDNGDGGGDISSVMISSDMTEYVLELNDEIKTLKRICAKWEKLYSYKY